MSPMSDTSAEQPTGPQLSPDVKRMVEGFDLERFGISLTNEEIIEYLSVAVPSVLEDARKSLLLSKTTGLLEKLVPEPSPANRPQESVEPDEQPAGVVLPQKGE